MKRKQILFSVLLLFSVVATQAARVDTIMVKSPSMNKEVQVVYVLLIKHWVRKLRLVR